VPWPSRTCGPFFAGAWAIPLLQAVAGLGLVPKGLYCRLSGGGAGRAFVTVHWCLSDFSEEELLPAYSGVGVVVARTRRFFGLALYKLVLTSCRTRYAGNAALGLLFSNRAVCRAVHGP